MDRQEVYDHIDALHNDINKLKGEYIALTDDELKCINTSKFDYRTCSVIKAVDSLARLARDIQAKRTL